MSGLGVNFFGLNNLIGGLAGRAVLRVLLGCEAAKGSNGNQQDVVQDTEQDTAQEQETTQGSFCPSQYYICDEFEGEEIETDVWTVSVKGAGVSYGAEEGELTMSNSQGYTGRKNAGVDFVSAQSAGLPESGNFLHSIEAMVKLNESASFSLGDGTNMCKIGTEGAICGDNSIYDTDYYEAVELADVSKWHVYSLITAKTLDRSDEAVVTLYQDSDKILSFHKGPASVEYSKFATDIGCWVPEIGSCTFDYVRGQVADQNQW